MKRNVLLTPGPLTTSLKTKEAMLQDVGTRDADYQNLIQKLRTKLLSLAYANPKDYTVLFMQGSGTFGVESVLCSTVSDQDKVLILSNGAYGERMVSICAKAGVPYEAAAFPMTQALKREEIEPYIAKKDITHVAYVHCETTAGVLNDIAMVQELIQKHHKTSIVDAMSSFASVVLNIEALAVDYLVTSSNKCLHGVPGAAIVFAKRSALDKCAGISKSLSLDLYEQYRYMEEAPGSFRFTSPTHVLLALNQAIDELVESGGIEQRNKRYCKLQGVIIRAMRAAGFETLIDSSIQSPVITTFLSPKGFSFEAFYQYFKENGFLLYSGKLPGVDAFRIGNIGDISDEDVQAFLSLLENWKG